MDYMEYSKGVNATNDYEKLIFSYRRHMVHIESRIETFRSDSMISAVFDDYDNVYANSKLAKSLQEELEMFNDLILEIKAPDNKNEIKTKFLIEKR